MRQSVEATAAGSRLDLHVDYDLPGGVLGDVADRLYVERRNEREAEHSLQNLKDLVEWQVWALALAASARVQTRLT